MAYWEEATDRYGDRTHRSRLTEDHYDTAEESINASIRAQVADADIVRIFKGRDVEDEIGNWKDISDRVKAEREALKREEKAQRARAVAAENKRLQETQEKYERIQLQKLLEKYGPEGVDVP
jgi:galactokinase